MPKETEYERSIVERAKLRRQWLYEVKEREKHINNDLFSDYFNYSSLSNMCSILGDAKDEINKHQVYSIKKVLTKVNNTVNNVSKDKTFKIK